MSNDVIVEASSWASVAMLAIVVAGVVGVVAVWAHYGINRPIVPPEPVVTPTLVECQCKAVGQ